MTAHPSGPAPATVGTGVFFVLITLLLILVLFVGSAVPEWIVGVAVCLVLALSILAGLTLGQRGETPGQGGAADGSVTPTTQNGPGH
ncbi:MAG: hypothetical protein Q4G21_06470 [Dermabacter sp.]|nr:hypothetical protein [Dermabacter sp.]